MDEESHSCCPICLDTWVNVAYVMPCLHQFCFGCILRWAESKAECPLCKRCISSVRHSVRAGDEFSEVVIIPTAEPLVAVQQAGIAHRNPDTHIAHGPAASRPQTTQLVPRAAVAVIPPFVWSSLFQEHPEILEPVLPRLRQELEVIFGAEHWEIALVEDFIMMNLRIFGLNEDALVWLLEDSLQDNTELFVCWLFNIIILWCSEDAHRWLDLEDSHAAGGQDSHPAATPGPAASPESTPISGVSPSSSPPAPTPESTPTPGVNPSSSLPAPTVDELPSTSVNGLWGEEPHRELGQRAVGPSSPSQGSDRLHGVPWHPPKRRAGSSPASSLPCKKPPDQQH